MNDKDKILVLRELNAIQNTVKFALETIEEADPTLLGSKGAELIRSSISEKLLFIVSKIEEDSISD